MKLSRWTRYHKRGPQSIGACSHTHISHWREVRDSRVAGETAPLLFTAFGNQYWNWNLNQPTAALPLQIFTYAISAYDEWHRQAWAGALVLIVIVLVISIAARVVTRSRFGAPVD